MATRFDQLRTQMEKEAAKSRAKLRKPAAEYGKAWAALRALDGHAASQDEINAAILEAATVDVKVPEEASKAAE